MTMKKRIGIVGVLVLVAALGVLLASTAMAQTTTPPTDQGTTTTPHMKMWDRGFGFFGGGSTATYDAVAKALNLTPTELFDQLHSGKSLTDIAAAQGVDMQAVQDAMTAARTQAMKDAITQAVKDGKMTQAQADWLMQGLNQGFLGHGFGFGHMRGHGRGFFGDNDNAPQSTPSSVAPGTPS